MAIDRVSTFGNNERLIQGMMKNESKLSEEQTKSSSGLNSTDYAGIADQSSQLVSLKSYYARSKSYSDLGDQVSSKIDTMATAVGNMISQMTTLKTLVTNTLSASTDAASSVAEEASGMMETMAGLMNSSYNGEYVFAGGRSDTAPVDLTNYPAQTSSSTADTADYYKGGSAVASFRASDSLNIEYGVNADDSSMEKALRAISMVANISTDPVDTDTLDAAYTLANDASDGLTLLQTKLGNAGSTLNDTIDQHLDAQLTLQNQVEDIENVDLASSSTRLSQLKALLEASASVMTMMKGFNLSSLS